MLRLLILVADIFWPLFTYLSPIAPTFPPLQWALIKKPAQCGLLEEEIRQRHYNGELLQPT
jgi:hypothetical protein